MVTEENLEKRYGRIYQQLLKLLKKTENTIARMATVTALLHHKMPHFSWTGFYVLTNEELIVGPYQGPLACQVLKKKKGVCWTSLTQKETIIVADVHKFPGHIACYSQTNSEIVVPLFTKNKELWAVLDVDSRNFGAFSEVDRKWLEKLVKLI